MIKRERQIVLPLITILQYAMLGQLSVRTFFVSVVIYPLLSLLSDSCVWLVFAWMNGALHDVGKRHCTYGQSAVQRVPWLYRLCKQQRVEHP